MFHGFRASSKSRFTNRRHNKTCLSLYPRRWNSKDFWRMIYRRNNSTSIGRNYVSRNLAIAIWVLGYKFSFPLASLPVFAGRNEQLICKQRLLNSKFDGSFPRPRKFVIHSYSGASDFQDVTSFQFRCETRTPLLPKTEDVDEVFDHYYVRDDIINFCGGKLTLGIIASNYYFSVKHSTRKRPIKFELILSSKVLISWSNCLRN